jgi:hypothetical protein
MICSKCNTANDTENVFCVNCGNSLPGSAANTVEIRESAPPPTVAYSPQGKAPDTLETGHVRVSVPQPPIHSYPAPSGLAAEPPVRRTSRVAIVFGVVLTLGILIAIIAAAGGYFYFYRDTGPVAAEALPGHLGLFAQSKERDRVDEIKKFDFADAVVGKDEILKTDAIPTLDTEPNLLLYSDGSDIPLSDLRLVQIDTINADGTFKQIDFQAAPVEGKPEMKRLRVPGGLANGKYAFALMDGFINDGKHKFWAFRVLNATKSDNGEALKASSLQVKPAPSPAPAARQPATPSAPPPPGGTLARSTTNNLVLRSGPSQSSPKIRNLGSGEQVYIIEYSSNSEVFKGTVSRYALVQTMNGQRGWVFAAYLK